MSNRVTKQATASTPNPGFCGILQRKCASCGQHTFAGGGCSDCDKKKGLLQRRASSNKTAGDVPPIVHDVVRSPGQPLDRATRDFFEPRLGHDFSNVRTHSDARAGESARAINALAYTVGNNIVFGGGQYAPSAQSGSRLLAHELAHVMQQEAAGLSIQTKPAVDDPRDPLEREADVMADAVTRSSRSQRNRVPGGTLPYRQATDLAQCIRIMGDESREYCREVVLGDKPPEKEPSWTRKHTKGPKLMDAVSPAYQVWFDHILPLVPTGVTQMWQVIENTKTLLTKNCEVKTETDFIVDIVDIGSRKNIGDSWGWVERDDPCFAMEVSAATIGFDDQTSTFAEQTNKNISEADAKDLLSKMTGPKGTYSGTYTFVKSTNCTGCPEKLKELQKKNKAPAGSALKIDGVGSWPP